jgi:nucleotide-binding universal stress UspA family protein
MGRAAGPRRSSSTLKVVAVMEKVIVVVDGTAAGDAAVDWVVERGRQWPLEIELTGVFDTLPAELSAASYFEAAVPELVMPGGEAAAVYERALSTTLGRVRRELPDAYVTDVMRVGHVRAELAAASGSADLIVIGTQRDTEYPGTTYGTAAIRLAAVARCVTVVVPVGWPAADRGGVLVGLETTAASSRVADWAAREADRRGSELTVTQLWKVPTLLSLATLAYPGVWKYVGETHEQALDATLARLRAEWPDLALHRRIKEGIAARILAEDAAHSELLVVGRRGTHPVEDALLGSTSHGILLVMPCPVAVVPE